MPRTKKRPPILTPLSSTKRNNSYISSEEENMLKFMNKRTINRIFASIDKLEQKIMGLGMEIITSSNVADTFNNSTAELFKKIYNKKEYVPDRLVVKISSIIFNDGSKKTFKKPIYFFKSTGESRKLSDNVSLSTKDVWFPTNKVPFQMDFSKIKRISKLEDPILNSKLRPKDKDINILEFGRFLTLENTMISKYLSEILK